MSLLDVCFSNSWLEGFRSNRFSQKPLSHRHFVLSLPDLSSRRHRARGCTSSLFFFFFFRGQSSENIYRLSMPPVMEIVPDRSPSPRSSVLIPSLLSPIPHFPPSSFSCPIVSILLCYALSFSIFCLPYFLRCFHITMILLLLFLIIRPRRAHACFLFFSSKAQVSPSFQLPSSKIERWKGKVAGQKAQNNNRRQRSIVSGSKME